jgi:hypothetical protein
MHMTKKEAMEFLELPEGATESQVKQRLLEKLEYYENLNETAPSDFMRRLNNKNVIKLRTIQEDISNWSLPEAKTEIQFELEEPATESDNAGETNLTMPIIISSGSKSSNRKISTDPVAWLVRHTENKSAITFPLLPGKNYIGRKLHADLKPFLVLEDDTFVSRLHAIIEVETSNQCEVYLSESLNGDKPSKNGTYLNGDNNRIIGRVRLKDNDTIQVGQTKLILRINTHNNVNRIVEEVKKSKFMDTVVLRNN